jgi:hypothetical protein
MAGAGTCRPRMVWTSRPPEVEVVGGGDLVPAAEFTMRPGTEGSKRTGPDGEVGGMLVLLLDAQVEPMTRNPNRELETDQF